MTNPQALRRFLTARAISLVGDGIISTVIAFSALHLGASAADVGLVLAASQGAYAVTLPLGGLVGDRMPRQVVMVGSDLFRAASQAGLAVLFVIHAATLGNLIVCQVLTGAATGIFNPSADGFIPDVAPKDRLQRANTIVGMCESLARIGGPAVATGLTAVGGYDAAFGANAASYALSGALLTVDFRLRPRAPRAPALSVSSIHEAAKEGWAAFTGCGWLWKSMLALTAMNGFAIAPVITLGPIVSSERYSGISGWGAMMIVLAAGGVFGAVGLLRWRPKHPLRIAASCTLSLLPWFPLALALADSVPLCCAAAFFAGVQAAIFNTLFFSARQQHVAEHLRARLAAIGAFAAVAAFPVGAAAAGLFTEVVTIRALLLAAAGVGIACPAAMLLVSSVRNLTSAGDPSSC